MATHDWIFIIVRHSPTGSDMEIVGLATGQYVGSRNSSRNVLWRSLSSKVQTMLVGDGADSRDEWRFFRDREDGASEGTWKMTRNGFRRALKIDGIARKMAKHAEVID